MIHIFKYASGKRKGKIDFAKVKNGKFLNGSVSQGFERKRSALNNIKSTHFDKTTGYMITTTDSGAMCKRYVDIQDNTGPKPTVIRMWEDGKIETLNKKPQKPYHP